MPDRELLVELRRDSVRNIARIRELELEVLHLNRDIESMILRYDLPDIRDISCDDTVFGRDISSDETVELVPGKIMINGKVMNREIPSIASGKKAIVIQSPMESGDE